MLLCLVNSSAVWSAFSFDSKVSDPAWDVLEWKVEVDEKTRRRISLDVENLEEETDKVGWQEMHNHLERLHDLVVEKPKWRMDKLEALQRKTPPPPVSPGGSEDAQRKIHVWRDVSATWTEVFLAAEVLRAATPEFVSKLRGSFDSRFWTRFHNLPSSKEMFAVEEQFARLRASLDVPAGTLYNASDVFNSLRKIRVVLDSNSERRSGKAEEVGEDGDGEEEDVGNADDAALEAEKKELLERVERVEDALRAELRRDTDDTEGDWHIFKVCSCLLNEH